MACAPEVVLPTVVFPFLPDDLPSSLFASRVLDFDPPLSPGRVSLSVPPRGSTRAHSSGAIMTLGLYAAHVGVLPFVGVFVKVTASKGLSRMCCACMRSFFLDASRSSAANR